MATNLGPELVFSFTKNVNTSAVTTRVFKGLSRVWRESVGAFIKAAAEAMAVDSGMSVASFEPLAAKVRLATLIREISRGKGPKRGHTTASGRFADNNGPFKSRALGRRLGAEDKAFTLKFGVPSSPNFQFTFTIVVLQHFLHENGLGKGSTMIWNSMKLGEAAFIETFERRLPQVIDGNKLAQMLFDGINVEL
jgi:hypothetical protein